MLNLFSQYQAFYNVGTDLTDDEHWDHAVLLTGFFNSLVKFTFI